MDSKSIVFVGCPPRTFSWKFTKKHPFQISGWYLHLESQSIRLFGNSFSALSFSRKSSLLDNDKKTVKLGHRVPVKSQKWKEKKLTIVNSFPLIVHWSGIGDWFSYTDLQKESPLLLTFTCSKSKIETYFTVSSSVSNDDFEQVNISWVTYPWVNSRLIHFRTKLCLFPLSFSDAFSKYLKNL